MPPPVMCARAETQPARDDILERRRVADVRLEKLGADFVADFGDVSVRLEIGDLKDQLARQRISVGVQADGWQSDQCVTGLDILSGEKFFALDDADDESREVVFAGRVEAWHLRGFAADQRAPGFAAGAAHTLDKLLDNVRARACP